MPPCPPATSHHSSFHMWCSFERSQLTTVLPTKHHRSLETCQSSQIVSKFKSPRLSAPHTLHRFRLSREPNPSVLPLGPETSSVVFNFNSSPPSAASAAALSCAIRSASSASASASGESSMVSKLEILGLRDRADVGVEGTDDEANEPG